MTKLKTVKQRQSAADYTEESGPCDVCGTCYHLKPGGHVWGGGAMFQCERLNFGVSSKKRIGWCKYWREAR
jgi:hypothetical protein